MRLLAPLVLSLLVWLGAAQAAGAEPAAPAAPLLATFRAGVDDARAAATLAQAGVTRWERLEPLPVYRLTGELPVDVSERLLADPVVRAVDNEGEQVLSTVPNDPLYRAFQWNLRRIGMEQLWDLRPTAPEIVVAVLDTGVDLTHPDLRPNLLVEQGYDFIRDLPDPQDDESHGTAVAGIVGAVGNNREGVAGIAWMVKVLPIKALNARGRGPDSAMVRAIVYAADQGARIINISSTGSRYSAALEEAVTYAQAKGALVIAAAGNSGDQGNAVTYPAAFPGVLAVAAVDERDQVAPFSQHGSYIGLAAPGVDVASTAWPGAGRGLYASQSGTSIAAPHVAGVAALLWSMRPDLTADQIAQVLLDTAEDIGEPGRDDASGAGIVNARKATEAIRLGLPMRREGPGRPILQTAPAAPLAAAEAQRRWYFAEGTTNRPFETRFAIFNGSPRASTVRFTFARTDGTQTVHAMVVGPNSRATLAAEQVVPNAEFSTLVEADSSVFVERTMLFGHDGHTSSGAVEPVRTWYLAEGSTVPPFDTWVLLFNPNPSPTIARLRFTREDGTVTRQDELLAPMTRRSVYVNALFRASGFSTEVQSDLPIVVERSMYLDAGGGGHGSVAAPGASRTWLLAEGASVPGIDTWLLLQNTADVPANVRVTFLRDDGEKVEQPVLVPPRARASLFTNLVVPNGVYGMQVQSDQPIVAERTMYLDGGKASFNTLAAPAPARDWYLPEGSTAGSFVEQVAILNPNAQAATVTVDLRRQDGQPTASQRFTLAPASRFTLDVNPLAPDSQVAIRVTADQPIVAERTLYFAQPTGIGATSSLGLSR